MISRTPTLITRPARISFKENETVQALPLENNSLSNISEEEINAIVQKNVEKYNNLIYAICGGIIVFFGTTYLALISGRYDITLNKIATIMGKPINKIKDLLRNIAKRKINIQTDFTKARDHIHSRSINNKGIISGAHEIKECIATLKENKGNIILIKPSKTRNGIWDILYEINGTIPSEPKSVYIEEKLSQNFIDDLNRLCKKYGDKNNLKETLEKLVADKNIISASSLQESAEKALLNGYTVRSADLEKCTEEALIRLHNLKVKLHLAKKNKELQIAKNKSIEARTAFENYKKSSSFDHKSDTFKKLMAEARSAEAEYKSISRKLSDLEQALIPKAEKTYNTLQNTVKMFGEKDGNLYAAFAHYEGNKLIVDSYFPIAHGSNMQREFLDIKLNKNSISLLDIKYLIGAQEAQIRDFFKKIWKKYSDQIVGYFILAGFGSSSAATIASTIHIKEKEKDLELEKELEQAFNSKLTFIG